jgi:hypothetical protein
MRALRPTIALVATILAVHVIEFVGGLRVEPVSIYLFPAALVPMLLTLLIAPWLAVQLVPLRRPHLLWRVTGAIAVIFALLAFCTLSFRIPSYLLGFAYQVHRVATPEQIERAGTKCLEIYPNGGQIGAPFAFLKQPGDEERWQQLKEFAFAQLGDHDCTVYVDPPLVEFSWGGALIGHTGVRYSKNGNLRRSWDYRLIHWNSTVAFFQSP